MQIISMIIIIITAIFTIYEMKKAKNVFKNQWFKELDRNEKIKITGFLKSFWKKDIIMISILLCWFFVIISTFLGAGSNYKAVVSILAVFYSIITIIIVIVSKKKYYFNIEAYLKNN